MGFLETIGTGGREVGRPCWARVVVGKGGLLLRAEARGLVFKDLTRAEEKKREMATSVMRTKLVLARAGRSRKQLASQDGMLTHIGCKFLLVEDEWVCLVSNHYAFESRNDRRQRG
jgi:hypothetical protein